MNKNNTEKVEEKCKIKIGRAYNIQFIYKWIKWVSVEEEVLSKNYF